MTYLFIFLAAIALIFVAVCVATVGLIAGAFSHLAWYIVILLARKSSGTSQSRVWKLIFVTAVLLITFGLAVISITANWASSEHWDRVFTSEERGVQVAPVLIATALQIIIWGTVVTTLVAALTVAPLPWSRRRSPMRIKSLSEVRLWSLESRAAATSVVATKERPIRVYSSSGWGSSTNVTGGEPGLYISAAFPLIATAIDFVFPALLIARHWTSENPEGQLKGPDPSKLLRAGGVASLVAVLILVVVLWNGYYGPFSVFETALPWYQGLRWIVLTPIAFFILYLTLSSKTPSSSTHRGRRRSPHLKSKRLSCGRRQLVIGAVIVEMACLFSLWASWPEFSSVDLRADVLRIGDSVIEIRGMTEEVGIAIAGILASTSGLLLLLVIWREMRATARDGARATGLD